MTARILDGRRIAENLLDELKVRVDARVAAGMNRPGLAVVLVGGDPASAVYVRNKRRAAEKVGIQAHDRAGRQREQLARLEQARRHALAGTDLPEVLELAHLGRDVAGAHGRHDASGVACADGERRR